MIMDKIFGFKIVDLKVLSQYELLKLVKNGDFESGDVDWIYSIDLPSPIQNKDTMSGMWYALLAWPKADHGIAQVVSLPSDAETITFLADIKLLNGPITKYVSVQQAWFSTIKGLLII